MKVRRKNAGHFKPGHKKMGGIKKGGKHRFTSLKDAFIGAFQDIGGRDSLADWADKNWNKKDFYKIMSSMLPKDVNVTIGGEDLAQAIKEARERGKKPDAK